MTDLQRFGWAFSVICAVAAAILVFGAVAANATTAPSPSPTPVDTLCDETQGLVATDPDWVGDGCVVRVTLEVPWMETAVLAGALIIGSLFALVALNVRR